LIEAELVISTRTCLTLSVQIKEMNGSPVYHFPNSDACFKIPESPGVYRILVKIPPLQLYPGQYGVQLTLCASFGQHFEKLQIVDTLGFSSDQDYDLCSRTLGRHAGLIYSQADWECDAATINYGQEKAL
jgi:hypothetical protein